MRVLHAYPEMLSTGGRPSDSRSLVSAISALGHETAVITCLPAVESTPIHPETEVQVHVIPNGLASIRSFRKVLDEVQPDVVHFTGGPRIPSQTFWAREVRKKQIPYFVSACGNLSPATFRYRWGTKKNRFYHPYAKRINHRLLDRPFLRRAAAVHAASPNEAAISKDAGASTVFVAPFGVNEEWLARQVHERTVHTPVTFAYLGRLSIIHKGLDLIVEAFGKVVEAGYGGRFRLILAGTDENGSMETLKKRVEILKIDHVSFPGGVWADDKQTLWNEADYFLHTCRFNGFALSVREAIGQGLPIISSFESDLGDWTESSDMGFVVQLSPDSIADAIISALETDLTEYAKISQNARRFAEQTNWSHIAGLCVEAYETHLSNDGN